MAITDTSSVGLMGESSSLPFGQSGFGAKMLLGGRPPQAAPALPVHAVTARPVLGAQGSFRV